MKLPCFKHSEGKNESHRIFKKDSRKKTRVTDLPGAGDVSDWVDWRGDAKEELPSWAKKDPTLEALKPIRTAVETKKSLKEVPRPVTPKAKEKLKFRTQKEIFGTRECQEWYINALREALETMDGDKLYDFIRAHPKYSMTSYIAWNEHFAELVGIKPPAKYRGNSKKRRHVRHTLKQSHHDQGQERLYGQKLSHLSRTHKRNCCGLWIEFP